ncbi:MAG TPA: penicillin acylase family protein [Solirubrobacteraceae bacterium]|nr:penicillin acylase family protein [Solirubrobacteraceae bacterium]
MRRPLTVSLLLLAVAAAPAAAQDPRVQAPDFGGVRNVLPAGQGETANAAEVAAFLTGGTRPASFTNQLGMYNGLIQAAPGLQAADLDRFFKPATFGVAPGQETGSISPRPGAQIVRDAFGVPHVYGATRQDVTFGAGYASAQDRLFLMDVLRHTGRARLSELIGPGTDDANVKADALQLKAADYSEEELQAMIDTGARDHGAEGELIRQDLLAYVDGVNAYIAEARRDPSKMPGEYAAIGRTPADWKLTDTVAVASLIGGIFGRGGGAEAQNAEVLAALHRRFGTTRRGRIKAARSFRDFRDREDPEAPVTVTRRFPFDRQGKVDPRAVARLDADTLADRDPVIDAGGSPQSSATALPALVDLAQGGLPLPRTLSNALLVSARRSKSGHPIAVMGPQVGYYSPQILMEMDLHGPGFSARGAAFPGISLYILIGRGPDYAWSATTAYSDNVDEFAERLCEPDGSAPTLRSRHYLYKGRCVPFHERIHELRIAPVPSSPGSRARTVRMEVLRSVHGPVQSFATAGGQPVAIAEARSTYRHELDSAVAFKRLSGGEVTDARSFQRAMDTVNFAFNWFYADDRDIAYLQSGWYPRRARGVDQNLPAWGTGEWDWLDFDAERFTSARLPFAALPKAVNPGRGYFTNWNNKQAPGWRAADDQWTFGSVHRMQILQAPVRRALRRGGKLDLVALTRIMELGATIDVRGQELWPHVSRVLGRRPGAAVQQLAARMTAWARAGAHRRDVDGDGVLEHSGAVALMDAFWPILVQRMFAPVLGDDVLAEMRELASIGTPPARNGNAWGSGWFSHVDKDLRQLLHGRRRVRGAHSRVYCGRGRLRACREVVAGALRDAAEQVKARYGVASIDDVKIPPTCPAGPERRCDQTEYVTAGAIGVPPSPWQNRPTFQQVVEIAGHRPR